MDYGISENLKGDGEIKVLTMGNVQDGAVIIPENGCIDTVETNLLLRKNDLLFNRTNSFDLVGKVGLYEEESDIKVTFASYLVRMRTNEKAEPHFLNYVLNSESFLSHVRSLALRSLHQANLNPTRYGQLHIRIPRVQEQRHISANLNQQFQEINNRFRIIESSISLLNEYKTSLISHVVTGKISVS